MAAEALADISSALSQLFDNELERQWNRVTEAASRIPVVDGRGKNAAWDAQFTNSAVATSYAEGSDVQSGEFLFEKNVPATLSWGHYRAAFIISDTEIEAAASSPFSTDELMDIFGERVIGGMTRVATKINADLYTGTGTDGSSNPTIVGLFGGSTDATGIYANINRSTFSEWAGNVLGNGSVARALTMDLLYNGEQQAYTLSGMKPNLILCTPATARKYAGLFEAERRVVTNGSASPQYDSGTTNLFWLGIPVIRDKDAPAGKLIMCNTNNLELKQLPLQPARDGVRTETVSLPGSNGKDVRATSIRGRVTPLARNGDAVRMMVNAKVALTVKRPNSFVQINDINES